MDISDAVTTLEALAQASRLAIFRQLVIAGPEGRAPGQIAESMGLPAATLSFHLAQLKHAGLISCRRNGRSLIYSADFERMNTLLGFLTENCCSGAPLCPPLCPPVTCQPKEKRNEALSRPRRRR